MTPPDKPPFQYGLRSLFGLMTAVALLGLLIRWGAFSLEWPLREWSYILGAGMAVGVPIGGAAGAIGFAAIQWRRYRRRT